MIYENILKILNMYTSPYVYIFKDIDIHNIDIDIYQYQLECTV